MKNLILTMTVTLMGIAAFADSNLEYQKLRFEQDKQEYINNKCIINSVDLWFIHTCKDVAWEAGKILDTKGYKFNESRVEVTLGGPMKSVLVSAKITSGQNPSLSTDIDPREMVGKVISNNVTDTKKAKYLVLSLVDGDLNLVTLSSTRIGKQGITNDMFCQNSMIMARSYLAELKKLPSCKAVTERNDL